MIVRSFACLGFLCCFAALASAQAAGHTRLRIGLITPGGSDPAAASVARGVRLGAAEAKQTATLFGDDVELFEAAGAGARAIAAARQLSSGRQVQVLIAAASADINALSEFAESHRVLFLNPGSRSLALRDACRRYTFNVEATEPMYAAAGRMNPAPRASAAAAPRTQALGRSDSVVLWGSTLERFGASQINQRFRDKYHMEMDGPAWAGWAAAKIAAEAALRARSTAPTKLAAYLESPTTQFDGHKGWPLTFRSGDHQLRQPLYVVSGAANGGRSRFRDVPELRADVSATPSGDDAGRSTDRSLDALIGSTGANKCSAGVNR